MGWLKETFQSNTDSSRLYKALLDLASSYQCLEDGTFSRDDINECIAASKIPELAETLRNSEGERYVKSCVSGARNFAWKEVPGCREYIAVICELTNTSL